MRRYSPAKSPRGPATRLLRSIVARSVVAAGLFALCLSASAASSAAHVLSEPTQETGFLNRRIELHGVTYRFQVYLPEDWRRDDHKLWPIILALHGRGERGTEGMWQTQIGLPQQVRDHPERWPFVIVMPQCPQPNFWTDPEMMALALAALDQESLEFHGDPERTYLTGLSLGGYGAWEIARREPQRWAAIFIAASGVFWSYDPERWQQADTLPAEYARELVHTPIWLFHGMEDNVVVPRESELMFDAFKAAGGHVRLWLYQGLHHDCWTRAYNEPDLPRWVLAHRLSRPPDASSSAPANLEPEIGPFAERTIVPLHPAAIKLPDPVLDSFVGDYRDLHGGPEAVILRQGETLYLKNRQGETDELAAESPTVFFYPNGNPLTRLIFEHDAQGHVTAVILHDDRHEERWERHSSVPCR
jgi:dienelactone hydrolase